MLQIQCLPYRVAYHVVGVLDYTEGRQRFIKLYEALPRAKKNYMIRHNSINFFQVLQLEKYIASQIQFHRRVFIL